MTTRDLPRMVLPPFTVQKIKGLGLYTKQADDPDLSTQVTVLETILYAKRQKQQWPGDKLCNAVQLTRKKLKNKSPALLHDLPALNP